MIRSSSTGRRRGSGSGRDATPGHRRGIDLRGLQWLIDKMSFSYKDTRTRAGLFMPEDLECSSDSAARDSAAVLTAASRMLRRDKGERQILFS